LKAGVDLLLYCNDFDVPPRAFEAILEATAQGSLSKEDLEASYRRILDLKKAKLTQPDPLPQEDIVKVVGHPDHLKIAASIANGQIPDGLLPE